MSNIQYHELHQDDALFEPTETIVLRKERRRRGILSVITIIQLIALIVMGYALLRTTTWEIPSISVQTTSTRGGFPPVESGLRFQRQMFDKYGVQHSPTAQPPGPALDAAWHDLLSSMMVKVTPEELQSQTSESSIQLADGTGYVASLGVYHELHCIKLLKHWLHRDHYLADWDDARVDQYWKHLNHCLDWLKNAALCRSDTTLTTLAWNETILDTEYPVAFQCVDPDSLFDWARTRAVDVSEPGVLIKPS